MIGGRKKPNTMPKRQRTPSTTETTTVDFATYDEKRDEHLREQKYLKTGVAPDAGLNLKKGVTPKENNVGILGGYGGGAGFADAMSKLLGSASKPKDKKSTSKSSKSSKSKSSKSSSSSSQAAPILSKRKTPNMRKLEQDRNEVRTEKKSRQERSIMDQMKRDRPTLETYRYEKELKKIATRGVVALFNAVSEAQKPNEKESARIAKDMDKSEFLNMLKKKTISNDNSKDPRQNKDQDTTTATEVNPENVVPSYLKDDFMGKASMKHWDQSDEESEDDGNGGRKGPAVSESEEDSDSD